MPEVVEDKRCMTQLDADTLAEITARRTALEQSESKMIAILVKKGLAALKAEEGRRSKA